MNVLELRRKFRMSEKKPNRYLGTENFTSDYVCWLENIIIKNSSFYNPKKENLISNIEVIVWPEFDDFWDLYDKKVGKKSKIKKKFDSLPKKVKEQIMEYIPNYIISQPNKQFRKNPETFLNNEGWEDELIMPDVKPTNDQRLLENAKKNINGW